MGTALGWLRAVPSALTPRGPARLVGPQLSWLLLWTTGLAGCAPGLSPGEGFEVALQRHLAAIGARDLDSFARSLTRGDTLHLIFPDGTALSTPAEVRALHEAWFADTTWVWEGEVVRVLAGSDLAMALVRYQYRADPDAEASSTWLALVFRKEGSEWLLVHDQNTRIATPPSAS